MNQPHYDLLIKNARIVRPLQNGIEHADIAVSSGQVTQVAADIAVNSAAEVFDAKNKLVFPGLVDAHMHVGIYSPLEQDARSESQAAAVGGVTSALTYFRTGQYYLNRGGSYADFYPEVLKLSKGNYWVDYSYHLAPIAGSHIEEMDMLLTRYGVPSFKIFMFYGGYGLHGATGGSAQREFLMIGEDDNYDLAHFEFVMRGAQRLMRDYPELASQISVSLHCEIADILNAYTRLVRKEGKLSGLKAWSAARPPHSEGLAIWIASYLAHETECLNINLLHLTSRKAMESALMMQETLPHINFKREVTIGHLLLDYDNPSCCHAKVNPPIRSREDVEFLWQALLDGQVDWVVSDHACCAEELKTDNHDASDPDNIWVSKSGFGGTEYLLSGIFSEGRKRKLSYNRMAELVCWNPAQRYGLMNKGDIAPGYDADLVIFDADKTFVVRAAESLSSQGYTPFEGHELTGRVESVFLRGQRILEDGNIIGKPSGEYLKRPTIQSAA